MIETCCTVKSPDSYNNNCLDTDRAQQLKLNHRACGGRQIQIQTLLQDALLKRLTRIEPGSTEDLHNLISPSKIWCCIVVNKLEYCDVTVRLAFNLLLIKCYEVIFITLTFIWIFSGLVNEVVLNYPDCWPHLPTIIWSIRLPFNFMYAKFEGRHIMFTRLGQLDGQFKKITPRPRLSLGVISCRT